MKDLINLQNLKNQLPRFHVSFWLSHIFIYLFIYLFYFFPSF